MTLAPNSIVSKLLALGLPATCLAIAWLIIAHPILQAFQDLEEDKSSLVAQYTKYRQFSDNRSHVEAQGHAQQSELANLMLYFDDPSIDIAAARLQNLVTDVVRRNQGQMQMSQQIPGDSNQEPKRIRITTTFTTSMTSLVSILHQVDALKPLTLIDMLAIRAQRQAPVLQTTANAENGPFNDDNILNVELQVSAFFSGQSPP